MTKKEYDQKFEELMNLYDAGEITTRKFNAETSRLYYDYEAKKEEHEDPRFKISVKEFEAFQAVHFALSRYVVQVANNLCDSENMTIKKVGKIDELLDEFLDICRVEESEQ